MHTRIEDKSGEELIKIITHSIGNMLKHKMEALQCIQEAAEFAAQNWEWHIEGNISYVSAKYSPGPGEDLPEMIYELKNQSKAFRYIVNSHCNFTIQIRNLHLLITFQDIIS